MAASEISPSTKRPVFVADLSGQNFNPTIPAWFISKHLKSETPLKKLKLITDASDKTWEVELNDGRFAGGWKGFSIFHSVGNDDVLSFRYDGDMVFHVTRFGRSFSQIQSLSSTSNAEVSGDDDDDDDECNIFDDDYYDEHNIVEDDEEDNADIKDDDDNWTSEERARTETESYLTVNATASSLKRDTMCVLSNFARSNDLDKKQCEIILMNEHGKSCTLLLRHNKQSGQVFIRGGWRRFCRNNKIKVGSYCRFKFVQSGTKPVLQLCPNTTSIPEGNTSKANKNQNVSDNEGNEASSDNAAMDQNRILTLELKPYVFRSSQLRLPPSFTKQNGILEEGEITVVNEDGVEWKSHLVKIKGRGQFYIRGCKAYFVANGMKNVGDTYTVEVIRGGTSPVLKICSKVKHASLDGYKTPRKNPREMVQALQAKEETENQVQKRARVSAEGGPSCGTRASNKSSADPETLWPKQPLQPCSIFDHLKKVKQSMVDTLTDIRRFRSELEMKEKNLETSLLEIDELGEKISGVSKIFNVDQH